MILFTPRDMLCRNNSSLILRKNIYSWNSVEFICFRFIFRLKQLEPLLHAGLVVKEVKEDGGVKKYVVEHPNGSLINEIISKKLNEEMDTPIPFEIQGQEMGGHFDYVRIYS